MIALAAIITCGPRDRALVESLLPEHIRLTRQEPGCLLFQVVPDRCDPDRLLVAERFVDGAAFAAHQARTANSSWGRATQHLKRAYQVTETTDPAG